MIGSLNHIEYEFVSWMGAAARLCLPQPGVGTAGATSVASGAGPITQCEHRSGAQPSLGARCQRRVADSFPATRLTADTTARSLCALPARVNMRELVTLITAVDCRCPAS